MTVKEFSLFCGLFTVTVSNSGYTLSNGQMISN